jgi:crotonobetainyl-CoA:carnitine CoA-transferase CaiB-like acyl-CoA transferase
MFEVNGERHGLQRRAPAPGEHNTEVYIDELGLTPDELGALRSEGAV